MRTNRETDELETATSLVETLTAWAATNLDRAKANNQADVDHWSEEVRLYVKLEKQLITMTPAQVKTTIKALTPKARQVLRGNV